MEQPNWQEIARDLYEALMQNRHTRGLHLDDAEFILDATERYEQLAGVNTSTMMWRVNYHPSDRPHWITACRVCDADQAHLPTIELARQWCKDHQCISVLKEAVGE
jgi:hypothetical protein